MKTTREAIYQIKPAGKNKNNYTESKECVFDKAELDLHFEVTLRLPVFFGVVISLKFTRQYRRRICDIQLLDDEVYDVSADKDKQNCR